MGGKVASSTMDRHLRRNIGLLGCEQASLWATITLGTLGAFWVSQVRSALLGGTRRGMVHERRGHNGPPRNSCLAEVSKKHGISVWMAVTPGGVPAHVHTSLHHPTYHFTSPLLTTLHHSTPHHATAGKGLYQAPLWACCACHAGGVNCPCCSTSERHQNCESWLSLELEVAKLSFLLACSGAFCGETCGCAAWPWNSFYDSCAGFHMANGCKGLKCLA
eukprot:scaffold186313_cov20-Tisochrysis_lutea.AAC.1